MKMKEKHSHLKLTLPLAAALLLPSSAFAATNLPQSDAHLPEKPQENALESHLPTAGGGSAAAAFRLVRIDIEQDGTQLSAAALDERTAPYLRRTLAENAYRYVAEHRLLAQHLDDYIAAYREMFARREELERERLQRVEKFFPQC